MIAIPARRFQLSFCIQEFVGLGIKVRKKLQISSRCNLPRPINSFPEEDMVFIGKPDRLLA
jgi:hypothetical protein